jgi:ADP-ribosyl-[dinitrogen reductase] hydrolase
MQNRAAIEGCLLGTAVGDALGLPYEGLSPLRARRMLGEPARYRFLFGRGMVSDDTEHACLTLAAWRESGGDLEVFRRSLARRLRWWFVLLPAGMGLATLRAVLRLWFGVPPERSGIWSAGNGAAMRAGVLGVAIDDLETLREFVLASTVMTHRDPRAFFGALAIGVAAHLAARRERIELAEFLELFSNLVGEDGAEMTALLTRSADSAAQGESVEEFAKALGLSRGVSGFVNHTVPVVIQAWLRYPREFENAVQSVIRCGGDADTTAALVGGIVGAAVEREGISERWIRGLWEWPRTALWMERLAREEKPVEVYWLGQVCRNLVFLVVVLLHGFRRLTPPW